MKILNLENAKNFKNLTSITGWSRKLHLLLSFEQLQKLENSKNLLINVYLTAEIIKRVDENLFLVEISVKLIFTSYIISELGKELDK